MTDETQESEGAAPGGELMPLLRTVGRLDTVGRVRRELARLYKDVHKGVIKSADGTRRAYILTSIQKAIEFETFEGRLEALEDAVEKGLPAARNLAPVIGHVPRSPGSIG